MIDEMQSFSPLVAWMSAMPGQRQERQQQDAEAGIEEPAIDADAASST